MKYYMEIFIRDIKHKEIPIEVYYKMEGREMPINWFRTVEDAEKWISDQ